MKRIHLVALLVLVGLSTIPLALAQTDPVSPVAELATAQGMPDYLGSYNATTTAKTNAEVTTPFGTGTGLLKNKVLLIHNAGSVAIRLLPVATSTGDVTTTRNAAGFGVYVAADEKVTLRMVGMGYLSIITTSSTADVDVHELK
jgi:hypothetical protein